MEFGLQKLFSYILRKELHVKGIKPTVKVILNVKVTSKVKVTLKVMPVRVGG